MESVWHGAWHYIQVGKTRSELSSSGLSSSRSANGKVYEGRGRKKDKEVEEERQLAFLRVQVYIRNQRRALPLNRILEVP